MIRSVLVFLIFFGGALGVLGQEGRHLTVALVPEFNSWQIDGSEKTKTSASFLDLRYFHYGGLGNGVLLDVNASGLFSTLQGNNYKTSKTDSTQITNSNFISVKLLHFANENSNRFGILWGVDFLGKYYSYGAEEGAVESVEDAGGVKIAEILGMGITLGLGYEGKFLDDQLVVDGRLGWYGVYNSTAAQRNSNTFMAKGFTGKGRARYYLSDLFYGTAQLQLERMGHEPLNENVDDPNGAHSSLRLIFGAGIQF